MIKNEKIKAREVELTGINGEDLGIMPTAQALEMARKLKVDLVCTSLYSSPPPCRLIASSAIKEERQQAQKKERPAKLKEIRLTPNIEDHDYETKKNQAEKLLRSGHSVSLVVRIQGKEGTKAKAVLEDLLKDLQEVGVKKTGIQVSGKQAMVELEAR
ncbi:translation initiation factor IF-3 [Paenibacillus dakarensis]|uniref:translation initiation factor IF-3 n=1 Tax=Paenibacillus dakarensis TaxID=1527293 RepID=UPI0006D548B9|nr:translation initiation factor IF-3 [Paenibacillus dakarensis]